MNVKNFSRIALPAGAFLFSVFLSPPPSAVAENLADKPSLFSEYLGMDSRIAQHGFALDNRITQYYGGVVSGGLDEEDHYSGRWDFLANVDGDKAGLWKGLFLKMRVGANWQPIERFKSGTLLAPYTPAVLSKSDQESIAITDLSFVQMFSQNIGVTFGKIDSVDADFNSFAHGRGTDQFGNFAFVINPMYSFVPLSTIGSGIVALYDDGTPLGSLLVIDTHNVPTKSGFDDLYEDGAILALDTQLPTNFGNKPGRHRLGFAYTTADQIDLSQNPRFTISTEGELATSSDAWALIYNGEQYLVTDPTDPKKGWGIFARAGLSDSDKNIFGYFLSAGIGGTGMICGRPNDNFGVGAFYLDVSDIFSDRIDALDDESGIEAFYGAALMPWMTLTGDVQYVGGAVQKADEALIVSARLQLKL